MTVTLIDLVVDDHRTWNVESGIDGATTVSPRSFVRNTVQQLEG
jgi:hypothetical protein